VREGLVAPVPAKGEKCQKGLTREKGRTGAPEADATFRSSSEVDDDTEEDETGEGDDL
jgi:hypothetical protein